MAPLGTLLGEARFDFPCLQKEIAETGQPWLEQARPPLIRHGPGFADFADTAALVAQMNVVVSIDTAVAHLAGALAVPVKLILPFSPGWRWMPGRADYPW